MKDGRELVDVPPAHPTRWQRVRRGVGRWSGFAITVALLVSATVSYLAGEFDRAQTLLLMLIVLQLAGLDGTTRTVLVQVVRRARR